MNYLHAQSELSLFYLKIHFDKISDLCKKYLENSLNALIKATGIVCSPQHWIQLLAGGPQEHKPVVAGKLNLFSTSLTSSIRSLLA